MVTSAAVVLLVWLAVPTQELRSAPLARSSACRPTDDITVPERLAYLKALMSSSVPDYQLVRDSLGLATQNANRVRLVTKASTRQSGVNALNALLQTPGATREIWLFQLGAGYAIHDPSLPSFGGEPAPLFMFNKQFQYLSTLRVQ